MKLSELECCPFCGHDEFYTNEYVYGTTRYKERFDGKETENAELYDYLNTRSYTGRAYCAKCGKYLGTKETDTLSKQVQKALYLPTEKDGEAK